jgi:hypothetical protein
MRRCGAIDYQEIFMNAKQVERRADTGGREYNADVVRRGLLVQRDLGTISAIEFLKANAVEAAIIQRVLSGNAVRATDREALEALGQA